MIMVMGMMTTMGMVTMTIMGKIWQFVLLDPEFFHFIEIIMKPGLKVFGWTRSRTRTIVENAEYQKCPFLLQIDSIDGRAKVCFHKHFFPSSDYD